MNRPNQQKTDNKYMPNDQYRKKIGEYHKKTQDKIEKKEPIKLSESELKEGTQVINYLCYAVIFGLILLVLFLLV